MFINKKRTTRLDCPCMFEFSFISFGCFRGNGGDKGRG